MHEMRAAERDAKMAPSDKKKKKVDKKGSKRASETDQRSFGRSDTFLPFFLALHPPRSSSLLTATETRSKRGNVAP